MADELRPTSRNGGETGGENTLRDNSIQQSRNRGDENSSLAPRPSLNSNTENPPGHGLHCYDTLPVHGGTSANRKMDYLQTHAARVVQYPHDRTTLPPYHRGSQLFRRNPSNTGGGIAGDRMVSIPEGGRASADIGSPRASRRSNTSIDNGQFVSPGMRPRMSTMTSRPRGSILSRRPSVTVAKH